MQNKGLIKLFAILFGLVSVYQLSFTWFTHGVEKKAKIYAESKSDNGREIAKLEQVYLDSVANKPVINLGFAKFSYNDIKDKELNLGLDLKGGINAILQVSVKDILIGLSNNSKNPIFNEALANAVKATPSIHVIPRDERAVDMPTTGTNRSRITAGIDVVIIAKDSSDALGGQAKKNIKSIRDAVYTILMGWKPPDATQPVFFRAGKRIAMHKGLLIWADTYDCKFIKG